MAGLRSTTIKEVSNLQADSFHSHRGHNITQVNLISKVETRKEYHMPVMKLIING